MSAILDRDRDTASGATDAPHRPAAARNVRRPGRGLGGNDPYASPDGKSQRGDDGGESVGRSGNYEETEDGSTVCTGDEVERRQGTEDGEGYKMLHPGGDGRSNRVGIIVNVEMSKEVVRVERWQVIIGVWMMIRQQMVCVICVYGPQKGRTEAEKEAFREKVERLAGMSDGQTMMCVAGDFNTHIGVVEPEDE